MTYRAMKKLIDLSLDTITGVFPFLRYSLEESQETEEVTVSFSIAKFDGFGSESTKELVVAFTADSARFLKIPLESGKKFMSFGYDSLIQLFVFLVSFFSTYLDISIKQVLHFYFQKNMDWKAFLQFVLDSNLIDSTIERSTVFVYAIGELSFERSPRKRFIWTDYSFNKFTYEVRSDEESLFVLSFVLGYIQSVRGHDLLVSNLIDPEEGEEQDVPEQEEGAEGMDGMGGGMGGGLGGPGGPMGGGDLAGLGGEGLEDGTGAPGGDLGGLPGGDLGGDGGLPPGEAGEMPLPGEMPGEEQGPPEEEPIK